MKMKQVYSILNDVTKEILGTTDLVQEDLSNVVDVGEKIFDAVSYDHYVTALVNRIGKTIFVDRAYMGNVPSVLRDSWEFGSALMKIQAELPDAVENKSWELQDGQTYNQDIFYKPVVTAKFFNERVTFELDISITYKQVMESFNDAAQLNAFISMIFNSVEKSLTVKTEALIMRTINYAIASTLLDDMPEGNYTGTGVKAVNLFALYKTAHPDSTLTVENCLTDFDFQSFVVQTINKYRYRFTRISNLFNVDGKARFTPMELQHLVIHADLESSLVSTLYQNAFHNDTNRLDKYEVVPYWQGSGTDYSFGKTAKIDVKLASNPEKTVTATGVLGVLFDHEAIMVANFDRRVRTHDNGKGEFTNYFYKQDVQNLYDPAENFVVFYVA